MHQLQGNKEYGSEKKGYLLKKSDGYVCTWPGGGRGPCVLSTHAASVTQAPVPASWIGKQPNFRPLAHRAPQVSLRFNLLSLEAAVVGLWSLSDCD